MKGKAKRMTVTLLPEWEKDLDKLKKEVFYNSPKSELIKSRIKTSKRKQSFINK